MNNGFTSCFTIKTAPGTVVCPDDGFPVAARATTGGRLVDLMFRVLAEAIPDRVWAAGDGNSSYLVHLSGRDEGRLYSMMEPLKSGTGARPTGDGVEGVSPSYGNIRFSSVETLERDYPVRVREISFVPGTGGAGQYRGANAIVREYEFLAESAQLYCRTDRRHHVPWGLCGGSPGAPSRVDLSISGDDNFEALPVIAKRGVLRGSRLRLQTAGGGGYGKQSDRDPESIETDRRQGRT
jgi:N-methylhydantoinase B